MKNIYIAGPDVFSLYSSDRGRKYKNTLKDKGFIGLYPGDYCETIELSKDQLARDIFDYNTNLIRSSDGIIANLSGFRGPSADAGTIWEVGFARGLNIPVVGYIDVGAEDAIYDYLDKCYHWDLVGSLEKGKSFDRYNNLIEDFNLPDNLMIIKSLNGMSNSFESAVKLIKEIL